MNPKKGVLAMTFVRALTYAAYSNKCPEGVNEYRWAAMLRFLERWKKNEVDIEI